MPVRPYLASFVARIEQFSVYPDEGDRWMVLAIDDSGGFRFCSFEQKELAEWACDVLNAELQRRGTLT